MSRKTPFLAIIMTSIFFLAIPSIIQAGYVVLTEGSKIKYKKKNIVLLGGNIEADQSTEAKNKYTAQLGYLKVLLNSFKKENSLVLWLKVKDEELSERQVLTPVQHIDKQGMESSLPQQNMPAYDHVSLVQTPQLVPLSQDMNSGILARSAGYELVPGAKASNPYDDLEFPLVINTEQPPQSQLSQNSGLAHAADPDNDLSKRQRRKSRKSAHYNLTEPQGFVEDMNNVHQEMLNPRDNEAQGSVPPQQNVAQYDRVQPLVQIPSNGLLRNPVFESDTNSRRSSEATPLAVPGNYVQLSLLRPAPSHYSPALHRPNEAARNLNTINNHHDVNKAHKDRKDYESKMGTIELFLQDNAQNLTLITYNQFLNRAKSLYKEYCQKTGTSIDESNILSIKAALNVIEVLYTFQRIYSNDKKNIVVIASPELDIKAIETIFVEQGAQVPHYFRTLGQGLTKAQLQTLLKTSQMSQSGKICKILTGGAISLAAIAVLIWVIIKWGVQAPQTNVEPTLMPLSMPTNASSTTFALRPITAQPTMLPTGIPTPMPTDQPAIPTALPTGVPTSPPPCSNGAIFSPGVPCTVPFCSKCAYNNIPSMGYYCCICC